ncbi:ABC transporter ATP-binding protein [Agrococcus sp. HG114]|uniref:ABC transporter ATP-binding protein n=1 Tax=Agrococcus sp. HG114 TaxID=2969757 RepID=UPI00215AF66D|nr:ABC transporter ATP-binding protein [Agrococcus sp. HG114]MCR8669996.1 ABC transporter ATP-binding protein/permease [Agrococcus sp. HG114]
MSPSAARPARSSTALPFGSEPPPRLESVPRFLLWQASRQKQFLVGGIVFGVIWMLCQAVWPYLLGRAIDDGVATASADIWIWCGALLAVAVVQAIAGMLRHRMAVKNFVRSALRAGRLIGHHSAETGSAITATTASGEIVATVLTDALSLGSMFDVTARLVGGIVAYLVVSGIMLATSVELGLVVLIGVPVLGALLTLLIRPLHARQAAWREETGLLTTLGADTVAGLRVLRGIGGEEEFIARYAHRSQAVRRAGTHVAQLQSWLDGLQVFLPGVFLAFIVWFGARLVLEGAISVGELVAFYGYATFLVIPLRTAVEATQIFARGLVATRRIVDVLRIRPAAQDVPEPRPAPEAGAELVDVASGVVIEPHRFTGLVDADPDAAAAVATRLGRFADAEHEEAPVLWGGVPHTTVPVAELRRRIVVSDAHPHLFQGPLVEGLDVKKARDPEFTSTETAQLRAVSRAVEQAAAAETVEALPAGLREEIAERGRSFSGGQRQRLSLARALLTDAEVLVLIEPTSALDAHTEARIAASLRDARAGRTTVVVSASPLILDRMDVIRVLRGGELVGSGTHAELMRAEDELGHLYRSIVARSTNPAEPVEGQDLEAAATGAIDTLWLEAEQTGAIRIVRSRPDDRAGADASARPGSDADGPEGGADAPADR